MQLGYESEVAIVYGDKKITSGDLFHAIDVVGGAGFEITWGKGRQHRCPLLLVHF